VPKRVGFLYDKITSWHNLYLAYRKAYRHKKRKVETAEWMFNCEKYLLELQEELEEHRYQPQPYRYFGIKEPKERLISVAAFRDRVVHHALDKCRYQNPFLNQFSSRIPMPHARRKACIGL